jgi:hypothetical protein
MSFRRCIPTQGRTAALGRVHGLAGFQRKITAHGGLDMTRTHRRVTQWLMVMGFGVWLAAAMSARAAAQPDFSGTWQADLKASDFGAMGAPERAMLTVTHKEPEVTIHSEISVQGNPIMWEATCKTDGKECKGTKGDVTIAVQWQGTSLLLNRSISVGGMSLKVKETWTLSADGKTLTSARDLSGDQGSLSQKVIYTKS